MVHPAAAEEIAMSPFEEGRLAGYRDEPKANPYRRGIECLMLTEAIQWALMWDAGYAAGQEQGRADVIEKHREACR
jgi:hypothetical protein